MAEGKSPLIPKLWSLPNQIHKRLGEQAARQRLMDEEGHLLVVLHQPPSTSDNERRDPVRRRIVFTRVAVDRIPNTLLSTPPRLAAAQ